MAIIRPFRGVRYNPAIAGDLRQLVSPPYDVISPEQQTELHLRSPYNAVHLDLNQDPDRYGRRHSDFAIGFSKKCLFQEKEPALYFYAQEFTLKDSVKRRRLGVFAALRLEEFSSGDVRPHERTFESAKTDRLALLKACQAHLSSVFCCLWSWLVLREALRPAVEPAAIGEVEEHGGTHTTLANDRSHAYCRQSAKVLEKETLIIADGHHRYETALRYRQERMAQGRTSDEEPYPLCLGFLNQCVG